MRIFLTIFTILATFTVQAKTLRVAVLDTGFDPVLDHAINRCDASLDRDFTDNKVFNPDHGTNVVGLIQKYAKNADFCFIIIKWYAPGAKNGENLTKALEYAAKIKPDIVNISAGGTGKNEKEAEAVKKLVNSGIVVVAAAGNESTDLNKDCNYYPACYNDDIFVVGATDPSKRYSNYGDKHVDIVVGGTGTAYGITLTGTSQATAKATGMIVRQLSRKGL